MSTQTINAAENPALAQQLLSQVNKEPEKVIEEAKIVPPSETVVTLPGGFINAAGEVVTQVEVRELTGRDEEFIAKANSVGRVLTSILSRGTVLIGDQEATEDLLDQMYAGDRDSVLLGIFRATFGRFSEVSSWCSGCEEFKTLQINVDEDIEVKKLSDPVGDRVFTVKGKSNEYTVTLPTGKVQKELLFNSDKTLAEMTTILLEGTVRDINGTPVYSKQQVQNIGLADRRSIADALNKRSFGPIFEDVKAACPDCSGEVVAPISLGTLFQF